jgi:hypothetical protein
MPHMEREGRNGERDGRGGERRDESARFGKQVPRSLGCHEYAPPAPQRCVFRRIRGRDSRGSPNNGALRVYWHRISPKTSCMLALSLPPGVPRCRFREHSPHQTAGPVPSLTLAVLCTPACSVSFVLSFSFVFFFQPSVLRVLNDRELRGGRRMANGRALGCEKRPAWTMARGLARQNRPPSALPAMPCPLKQGGTNTVPTRTVVSP